MKVIQEDVLIQLHKDGLTVPEMSQKTGWNKNTIYPALKRIGLRRHSAALGKRKGGGKRKHVISSLKDAAMWSEGWYKIARGEWNRDRTNFALAKLTKYTTEAEREKLKRQ